MTAEGTGALIALGVMLFGPLILVVVVVLAVTRRSARRRDGQLASQWENLWDQSRAHGWHVCYVAQVDQYARRGSKAHVFWPSTGQTQDTWFWWWHATPGTYIALSDAYAAYGPHTGRDGVLYVGHYHQQAAIHLVIPGQARAAWQRRRR